MSGKLSRFQMRPFTTWNGVMKENSLAAMGLLAPQKLSSFMVQLLAFKNGKTLDTFLSQFPTLELENDQEITWDVIGSDRRNVALVRALDENKTPITAEGANVGANGAPFYLEFNEAYFFLGEVIFGELNELYQIRIIAEPVESGSNYLYKVQTYGHNNGGIPRERLQTGERFSTEYAPVSREFSRGVGGINGSLPTSMRNEWTTIRIKHKVPGNRLDQKLAVGVPVIQKTESGYTHTTVNKWIHLEDLKLEEKFQMYKNNAMMFGTSTRLNDGTYNNYDFGGAVIKAGSGLREQMEAGNVIYYNHFSIKLLVDALGSISAGKLGFNNRMFILKTGEAGAIQFHEEVLKDGSGWQQIVLDNSSVNAVAKTTSQMHTNALKAGFQFTEFLAPNGIHIKVEVDDIYDDPVKNKIKMPGSTYVAESYRYDIFDIGNVEEPNIQKIRIKGRPETRSYIPGIRNPFTGQYSVDYASTDEDSTEVHKMDTFGVIIKDPTRVMSLIPDILSV